MFLHHMKVLRNIGVHSKTYTYFVRVSSRYIYETPFLIGEEFRKMEKQVNSSRQG